MTDFEEKFGISFDEAVKGLDELKVVHKGQVQYVIGLICTLYFKDGDKSHVRERVVECFDLYQSQTGNKLNWGAEPKTGRPTKLKGTDIAKLKSWVPEVPSNRALELVYHGGIKKGDASHYTVKSLVQQEYPGELSSFSVALPLSWVADKSQGAFVKFVLNICEILQPFHGYAGLAVIPHVNTARGTAMMDDIRAIVMRFHGVEIDLPVIHGLYLKEGIKGINWLTVLDSSLLEKLGGKSNLRESISDENILLSDFSTGTMIQAGPQPAFGDLNRNEDLPYYKKVARALKPIRADYKGEFGRNGYFNKEQTQKWLNRFDTD